MTRQTAPILTNLETERNKQTVLAEVRALFGCSWIGVSKTIVTYTMFVCDGNNKCCMCVVYM